MSVKTEQLQADDHDDFLDSDFGLTNEDGNEIGEFIGPVRHIELSTLHLNLRDRTRYIKSL